jgi:hypothetical protein
MTPDPKPPAPAAPAPTLPPAGPGELPPFMNHTLPIGTMVGGLQITGLIGEGGFGIVYLAFDTTLQRQVALKEYMPSSLASRNPGSADISVKAPRFLETFNAGLRSFVNEARLLAHFDHPSLVKVHQFWQANRTAYMVMPYYQGPTLKAHVATLAAAGRRPDEGMLRGWLVPLMDALGAMHAENCFHRDIAPDNILLTANGPLLLDFGAARRVISDMTQALTVILKPGYAPIEQYGDVATMTQGAWTDLYALASVVYYCIVGHSPITSVERVMGDPLPRLSRVAAGQYSATFLAAIDAALAVRPADRPQSVAEFRELLEGRAQPRPVDGGVALAAGVPAPPAVPAAFALDQTLLRSAATRGLPGGPAYAPTAPMTAPPGPGGAGATGAAAAPAIAPTQPEPRHALPPAAGFAPPTPPAPAAPSTTLAPAARVEATTSPGAAAAAPEHAAGPPSSRRGALAAALAGAAAVAVGGGLWWRREATAPAAPPAGPALRPPLPAATATAPGTATPAAAPAAPALPAATTPALATSPSAASAAPGTAATVAKPQPTESVAKPQPTESASKPPPTESTTKPPPPRAAAAPATTPPRPAAPAPVRAEARPAPRPSPGPGPAPAPQAAGRATGPQGTAAFPVPAGSPSPAANPSPAASPPPAQPAVVPPAPPAPATPPARSTSAAPAPAAQPGPQARCAELQKKGSQGTLTLDEASFLRKECR